MREYTCMGSGCERQCACALDCGRAWAPNHPPALAVASAFCAGAICGRQAFIASLMDLHLGSMMLLVGEKGRAFFYVGEGGCLMPRAAARTQARACNGAIVVPKAIAWEVLELLQRHWHLGPLHTNALSLAALCCAA